jgi:hypothetical protein
VPEWNSGHRLVAQMHREWVLVRITSSLWLVSAYTCSPPSQLTSIRLYPARLLSFLGKPGLDIVTDT